MSNIILLVVCFTAGMILRRSGRFPESTSAVLNGFIIHISLPSLAILHLHRLVMDPGLLLTAAMAWIVFAGGFVFFRGVGRRCMGLSTDSIGALILVGGLGNTSFVGFPMIEAYYGKDLIGVGLIADQPGSFLVLSTLGILAATFYSGGNLSPIRMASRVMLFPPFQAMLLAIALRPVTFAPWVEDVLQRLGDTLTPLALASVGFQLRYVSLRSEWKALSLGLAYKLVLAPAIIYGLYVVVLERHGIPLRVTIFEAAMAPMITAGIVAAEHRLNPPLATLMLGIGIPLSFLTLAAWFWLLQGV